MTTQLPTLGRNPLNVLNIISGCERQSIDYVNASAVFTRGYVGRQQIDSDGNLEWIVCPDTAGDDGIPHGILNSHKASEFYRSVTDKVVTLDANGSGNTTPYLKETPSSVLITTSGGVDITSGFTINYTTGVIVDASYAGLDVLVSYMYNVQEAGVDETLGSGKTAIIRGTGEIETLVFDTSEAITLGDSLYSVGGILTVTAGTNANVVATVVRPPTYKNPRMRIRISL